MKRGSSYFNFPEGIGSIKADELNEVLRPHFHTISADLTVHYKNNGQVLIKMFIERNWLRMLCGFCVNEFEKEVPYQEDEKINAYVEKLNLEERWSKLLKRTLVMIKTICST